MPKTSESQPLLLVLGLIGEAGAQHRVLGGDPDRAGVEVALAHHDAAGGDQGCRRKPNSSAPLAGLQSPFLDDLVLGTDNTPASDAMITWSSSVIRSRAGRSPLRSSVARSDGYRKGDHRRRVTTRGSRELNAVPCSSQQCLIR
jgi:hypothetical protein